MFINRYLNALTIRNVRSTAEFARQTSSCRSPPARPPPCELGFLEREGCRPINTHTHLHYRN
ncbi:hypothetical protein PUN28_008538 [Cardiocondyla obscurior]|uniref:Uncharacterized protein n=1 Tax=Cardiocondyla obscurior TaxID=286306 RepID=A0AAW2FZR9_9HYME